MGPVFGGVVLAGVTGLNLIMIFLAGHGLVTLFELVDMEVSLGRSFERVILLTKGGFGMAMVAIEAFVGNCGRGGFEM